MEMSLKAARVNAGLTQKEAAKALKISKGTILSYEKYRTKPDIDTAKKIAELYGVTVNDIFFAK
nr:helix-turn-helix transcriptional regulator [uncultured Mogibacterium sp.]